MLYALLQHKHVICVIIVNAQVKNKGIMRKGTPMQTCILPTQSEVDCFRSRSSDCVQISACLLSHP